ncbi:hypothetical protein JXQ70_17440 [bacterium]|nr:hypothetical protein [bacterium]
MNSKNYVLLLCLILFFVSVTGCSTINGNGPDNTPTPLVKTYPNWQQVSSDIQPNSRHQYGLAYDCHRNVIVMYGGRGWISGSLEIYNDTWEYSQEEGWTKIETMHNPLNRDAPAMIYDQMRKKIVMFGGSVLNQGEDSFYDSDETWEYNGIDWMKIETSQKPPKRSYHCMAYNSTTHQTIIFSGISSDGQGGGDLLNDTWIYDGKNWSEIFTKSKPSFRFRAEMAYDSKRNVVVLYGGDWGGGSTPDDICWEFDGEDWIQIETEHKPGPRSRFGFAFHEGIGRAVFFGGDERGGRRQDTWEYDGRDWTRIPTEIKPGRRTTVMVYNSAQQECFLFSGWDDNLNGYNDQWIYKYFEE